MRKIQEIQRELTVEVENFKRNHTEMQKEEADTQRNKIKTLTEELNTAREIDAADKAAAANNFSETEKKELNNFSFQRFIRGVANEKLDGFEEEMAEEGAKEAREAGRTTKGMCIPYSVLSVKGVRNASGQNANTAADGGNLAITSGPTYIESLRANLVMQRLGARFLTGLVGTLSFVKNSKVDIAWAGESEIIDNKKIGYMLHEMKQKRMVITTAFTKDLLNQTSLDIESMLMMEMVLAHAQGLDDAAINGDGVKAPKGILNIQGIGAVAVGENGGAISWKDVVALETEISTKDASLGKLSYLTNPKVMGVLKTTEKANGTAKYLMELANELNGYGIEKTNLVPANISKGTGTNLSAILFGNFNDLIIGQWGGLDVIVDPYTLKKSGQVEITMNAWHDIFTRHDESFSVIKDIVTQ